MWNFSKYGQLWQVIASRHTPPGPSGDCGWNAANVALHLEKRGIVYQGQCGQENTLNQGQALAESAGMAIAQGAQNIPGPGTVVGAGVGIVTQIFSALTMHHAQAVKMEQSTICEMVSAANQAIPQLDNAVVSGQITAAQGIAAMGQLVAQLKQIIAPVSGVGSPGHPCNAGCCYGYVLDCHQDFAQYFYVDISPMPTITNPSQPNSLAPASSLDALLKNIFPNPGSPTTANSATGTSGGLVLILLLVIGAALVWRFAL